MICNDDPVAYLAILNNNPPGALLNTINNYIQDVTNWLSSPAIENGLRDEFEAFLVLLNAVKVDVQAENPNDWIESQKVKAQSAIDWEPTVSEWVVNKYG